MELSEKRAYFVDGRDVEQRRDALPILAPQSQKEHNILIEFFDSETTFLQKWAAAAPPCL